MLGQLWDIWMHVAQGRWSLQKADNEAAIWMSQHSVDADNFAFDLACTMRAWLAEVMEMVQSEGVWP